MSEEDPKVEAATEAAAPADSATEEAAPKKKGKKWPIVVGVVVVVLIAAGAGFWVWHEQPSFCNAICHTPMDPYVATYEQEPGQPGIDKYGEQVKNTSSMLVVQHKQEGKACLDCHIPTIGEQLNEVGSWVTGNYNYPLDERDTGMLSEARGLEPDSFCLNESCHNMTRKDLIQATSGMKFNPHVAQHGERACTDCHKAHRASVMVCTQCHQDQAEVPDGWLSAQDDAKQQKALKQQAAS